MITLQLIFPITEMQSYEVPICIHQDLVLQHLYDWKPMQGVQRRWYIISFTGMGDQSASLIMIPHISGTYDLKR